jgi:CRISP-associated protein Cas1
MLDRVSSLNLDDNAWAERNEYWLKKTPLKSRRFSRRGKARQVLILSGHGVRLCVDHGTLWVRNGFTHYPQQREEWRFFSGDWRLPSRIVLLDGNGGITFDALSWLSNREIPLVQINWRGEVTNVIGLSFKTSDSMLAKSQLAARTNGRGLQVAKQLLMEKIANSVSTLRHALPRSGAVDAAVDKLKNDLELVKRHPPANLSRLMGVEGRVGYAYFNAWRVVPIRWKGIDLHPVPEDWHRIERRGSKVATLAHPNRNATHPVNSMLNYAYAILENQVRMQVLAAGLDPAIGFLHGSYSGKQGLVYDLMEPLRPVVDRKLLEFVQRQTFAAGDFTLASTGVCRLNPQLARNVVRAIDVSADVEKCVGRFVRSLK